jgi:maleamate amidohydrolase
MAAIPGFGGRSGMGRRPALLVVDMSRGFTDPDGPLRCDADDALAAIATLLDRARATGVPRVFTTVVYGEADMEIAAAFLDKVPALRVLRRGSPWTEIDPRIAPAPDERVVRKLFASAFFGTQLAQVLRDEGVDSVLVTGASTSGCVRATAVDALQYGFRTVVAREAVADRDRGAHEQSLADIDAKYGDVIALEQALGWLKGASR